MIIECTSCHSKYQYDEERFERKPSKKIKCAKCQAIFEIHNPAFAQKPAAGPPRHDATHIGKTKVPESTEQSPLPEHDARATGKQPTDPRLPAGKRLSLAVLDGNDAGSVFRIDKPRVTIGRSGADLILADSEASRQHAAVEVRETIYTLHDLESTNGTFVDGRRLEEPLELQDKSEFQIGTTTLMFIVTDET